MPSINRKPTPVNRVPRPRDGWRKVGRKIDTFRDSDPEPARCDDCGHRVRYLVVLKHDDYDGHRHVGQCCAKRLTLRWYRKPNGNWCLKAGRRRVTVYFDNIFECWRYISDQLRGGGFASDSQAKEAAVAALYPRAGGRAA